jgi:hypothetical protein
MKVYCWRIYEYETHSFYVVAESKEHAFEQVKKYIEEKLKINDNGYSCDDLYNFPEDYDFEEKEINEVFTSYYPG